MGALLCAGVLIAAALLLLLSRARPTATNAEITHPAALGLMLQESDGGLYVLAVSERGPARDAGIRPGDLLTALNSTTLETLDDMDALLGELLPGQAMSFALLRGGMPLTVRLSTPR